jgi:hypothetical protein
MSISSSRTEADVVQIRRGTTSNSITLNSIDRKVDDLCQLMQSPQLLRSSCDVVQRINLLRTLQEQSTLSPSPQFGLERACHCHKRIKRELNQYALAGLRLFRRRIVSSLHSPDCPYYYGKHESESLSFGISSVLQLLSVAVQISFETTKGAGGLSISIPLGFRPIVPYDSPGIIFFRKFDEPPFTDFCKDEIKAIPAKLRKLFCERKASPRDSDARGQSLMHVSCLLVYVNSI